MKLIHTICIKSFAHLNVGDEVKLHSHGISRSMGVKKSLITEVVGQPAVYIEWPTKPLKNYFKIVV